MAGYTKAEFDQLYRFRVTRYFGGRGPGEQEVYLHYHKHFMTPILADMWATLQPILQIQSTDAVCVVGAGFGWGVDAIIAETGATVVGIDISDYIAAEQTNTEETEIRAEITAAGYDPDSGRGAVFLAGVYDAQPRSNVIVLQNDASTGPQRSEIRTALGGSWPSVCVAEEVIDSTWTETDIVNLRNAMNGFGGSQRMIIVSRPGSGYTSVELKAIVPDVEIITPDGTEYLP